MTDIDRLQFHFPEEVQARIEDLDRRIEGARAEEEDHQRALSRLQNDLAQSMALRKAVFETAEIFLRNVPSQLDQSQGLAVDVPGPESLCPATRNERKRRDIRGEVLAAVRITGPTTVSGIVVGLNCQRKQVETALAYHERDGRVAEGPAGVWHLGATVARDSVRAGGDLEWPKEFLAGNGQQTHTLPDYRQDSEEPAAEDEA